MKLSTWVGQGTPRYLPKHDPWICLWRCSWKRLAFELGRWVKLMAHCGGPHPSTWGLEEKSRRWNLFFPWLLNWDTDCLLLSVLLDHRHLKGWNVHHVYVGFPWWFSGKRIWLPNRRCGFDPWVGKIPWRMKWQPTPEFLPGKSHGQRSLAGYSPWDHKRVRHNWATKQQQYVCVYISYWFCLSGEP